MSIFVAKHIKINLFFVYIRKKPVTGFACESERYTFAVRKKRFVKRKSPFPEKTGNGQYLSFAGMFFKTGRDV